MSDERILTVSEVAERLKVRPEAIRRWIRAEKLPAFLPGGTKTGYRIKMWPHSYRLHHSENDTPGSIPITAVPAPILATPT